MSTQSGRDVFLGANDACRLSKITLDQLDRWERTGVFRREQAEGTLYSFRDVVGLRTLAVLRERGVSLQYLRRVGEWIFHHYSVGTPWASLRFYVAGKKRKKVYFSDPEAGSPIAGPPPHPAPHQLAFEETFSVEEIASRVAMDARRLTRRTRGSVGKVEHIRGVVSGVPILKGTRIPVETIRNFHQAGYTVQAIAAEYPQLSSRDIEAALVDSKAAHRIAG